MIINAHQSVAGEKIITGTLQFDVDTEAYVVEDGIIAEIVDKVKWVEVTSDGETALADGKSTVKDYIVHRDERYVSDADYGKVYPQAFTYISTSGTETFGTRRENWYSHRFRERSYGSGIGKQRGMTFFGGVSGLKFAAGRKYTYRIGYV